MSVTRQSLRFKCSVKDCPWPKDKEIHVPWCLGIPNVEHWADKPTHQHYPKKGMGGNNPKSRIVAILCVTCHDRIDNTDWGNDVKQFPGRGRVYFAWDLHGNTLIEREVLSDGAEAVKSGSIIESDRGDEGKADPTLPRGSEGTNKPDSVAAHTSAPSPSAGQSGCDYPYCETPCERPCDGSRLKEESDGQRDTQVPVHSGDSDRVSVRGDRRIGNLGASHLPLTHEQRVAIAQAIKDTEWGRQWVAGDTANAWEAEMGQDAWQYLSDFGYQPESLSNVMNVCAAVPKRLRGYNLRFSHFVVVAGENLEDMEMHLTECEENQWSVAEFRRQVKGTKPRVKKWSRPELQERWDGFWYVRDQEDPKWDTDSRINIAFAKFMDWLSAEEQA